MLNLFSRNRTTLIAYSDACPGLLGYGTTKREAKADFKGKINEHMTALSRIDFDDIVEVDASGNPLMTTLEYAYN